MAYTVFARKYRPQRFSELVGQQAVATTLRNAVVQGRVAHAYLFCGPRGTGKTSTARILAKALNCAAPEDGEPCNRCEPCVTITEGRNFDVDEFDAASHRGVEDAEALIQRVRTPRPVRNDSRFRVFIVDEVHMMTKTAFNALLKTLEEPPPHVKFVFCTTEPEQVLETITSRCQRFDFKRIGRDAIVERLAQICQAEGIDAEPRALRLIAARARGGMRDTQSLLDQAFALAGERVGDGDGRRLRAERLEQAIGMAPREAVRELLEAVEAGRIPEIFEGIERIYAAGLDPLEVCTQLSQLARDLLVLASCPVERARALIAEPDEAAALHELAQRFGADRALHVLGQIAELEARLRTARDDRTLLELCFVKLARLRDLVPLREALERVRELEGQRVGSVAPPSTPLPVPPGPGTGARRGPGATTAGGHARPTSRPARSPQARSPQPRPPGPAQPPAAPPRPATPAGPLTLERARAALDDVVQTLLRERPTLGADVRKAQLEAVEDGTIVLGFERAFDAKRLFERDGSPTAAGRQLAAALAQRLGQPVALRRAPQAAKEGRGGAPARRGYDDVLREPEVRAVLERSEGGALIEYEEVRKTAAAERGQSPPATRRGDGRRTER